MASISAARILSAGPASPQAEVPSSAGYMSRKALPIKRNDAEMLTREDVQYDLLSYIFSDPNPVFTNPISKKTRNITFCDLYVNALYNSSKCSKVLKDKMVETPAFAVEFAKISLLTNVGRINTTMAFFPEMKTALRTYHPVPSLQRTDGNAQDAPRIKNCLKAAILEFELKNTPPSSPKEIIDLFFSGVRPPTSVVNLVFVLSNHATPLSRTHFDGSFTFLDLFLPGNRLASKDRARVFLWLMFHYLEGPMTLNPYDDEYARRTPGQAPLIRVLTAADAALENVDTNQELAWGRQMSAQRNMFLQKLVASQEDERRAKATGAHFVSYEPPPARRSRDQEPKDDGNQFMYYVPDQQNGKSEPAPLVPQPIPRATKPKVGHRDMFQQAWHSVMNTNPMEDSDDENPDGHVRDDYIRRLDIITKLRGKDSDPSPSPDEEHSPPQLLPMRSQPSQESTDSSRAGPSSS